MAAAPEAPAGGDTDAEFMNRFSRQNAAFGAETTMKMSKMKVLIVGGTGTAVEIAKNIVLQGIGGVTFCDSTPCTIQDTGVNFFIHPADVGKPRAEVLVPRMRELNPFCDIKSVPELSEEVVCAHAAVIVAKHMPLTELCRWDDYCRRKEPHAISFMYAHTGGVFGSVFVDNGPRHVVTDSNGENPMVRLVESIECGPEALVRITVPDGQQPGSFPDDAYVEFEGVQGCDGLLTHQEAAPDGQMVTAWKLCSKPGDPVNSVRIGDTSGFPPHIKGGIMTEKKVGVPKSSRSLAEVIAEPGFPFDNMVGTDMLNFGSELQIHLALHAALQVEADQGVSVGSEHKEAVIAKAKEMMASGTSKVEIEVDEDMFGKVIACFHVELQPFCAILGGIVGQEIVKIAGKYTPLPGFLHLHAMEALPAEPPADTAARGTRYDNLASVYGHDFPAKLGNLTYFMVGCGALGCEFLKNFALNGVCCGPDGKLTVTDADRIELSNLTRQFLFREHNVGQPKSRAAGEMVKIMNPDIKVESLEMFVGTKSEDHFNDDFWAGLDGVCNALDNMEARFYVDSQCVKYEKSLLESGTMGPAGNVDPVVPFETQTYRDGGEAGEGGGIPMCTLRNFPHLPDHCIEWARDQFEMLFVKSVKQVKKFYENPDAFIADKSHSTDVAQTSFELRGMLSVLNATDSPTIGSAGQIAFDFFHMLFRDKIRDLTNAFPEDARVVDKNTKQDKGPFWTGHKLFPSEAVFDPSNETHWRYQVAATALFAQLIGAIPQKEESDMAFCNDWKSSAWVSSQRASYALPEYMAGAVTTEDDGPAAGADAAKEQMLALVTRLEAYKSKPMPTLIEADFEKDDDANFHIEFITNIANLRADNYRIANSDFHKVKVIAGRIVPAIATTTACVCGYVMLEFFKVVMKKPVSDLRTRQVGLAVNTYTSFEPNPPKTYCSGVDKIQPQMEELPEAAFDEAGKVKDEYIMKEPYAAYPEKHSVWDKLKVPPGITLQGFKDWLKDEHKLTLKNWQFVLGWKMVEDDEGKEMKVPYSAPVYPPPVSLDPSLFPPLEEGQAGAMRAINTNAAIPPNIKMKYLAEWKKAKDSGALPTPDTDNVTADMTLIDVLRHMETKAQKALDSGILFPKYGKAIAALAGRKLWVIPGDQTPSCETIPEEGAEPVEVRFMPSLLIPLV